MKVLNFGSLNIDYVYSVDAFVKPGETKPVAQLQVNCGGKGLNQSIALARAGVETWHAGLIGPEGRFLKEELSCAGVQTQFVRTLDAPGGHAIIQVDSRGQNCILIYPGTNAMLTEAEMDSVLAQFAPGDVVLVQNETNLVPEIIRAAAARGLTVAFNAAPISEAVREYPLDKVDWLFVNEIEGAVLSGEQEPEAILRALRRRCPDTEIVLTLGRQGSLWAGRDGIRRCPACPVEAVDTTAAGDTFTGFFLRGVLGEETGLGALELATVASGISVTRSGAAKSIPLLAEVLSAKLRP